MHIRRHRPAAMMAALLAIIALLSSCNQDRGEYVRPIYVDYTVPAMVQLSFPKVKEGEGEEAKETQIPTTSFRIDHIRRRIYNSTPLPFGTELDSAYLALAVSNQLSVEIRNLTTDVTTTWNPTDTAKISFKGGLMQLIIRSKDEKAEEGPTTYDFRVMTYGYDPNKIIWTNIAQGLPYPSEEARLITLGKDSPRHALLTRLGEVTTLLEVPSFSPLELRPIPSAKIPDGLRPYSAYSDGETTWALDGEGALYSSADLLTWSRQDTGEVTPTQLLSVDEESVYFVGRGEDGSHQICRLTRATGEVEQLEAAEEDFPVSDSFVYKYSISGQPHMLLFGGHTASGDPVYQGYFSSDLIEWGAVPTTAIYPSEEGLYVDTPDHETLYLIGGVHKDGRRATILKSSDNGVTWTEVSSENLPGEDFLPLSHAAGYYLESEAQEEGLLILGGRLGADGKPSTQIWKGIVDRSAGIINDFDK